MPDEDVNTHFITILALIITLTLSYSLKIIFHPQIIYKFFLHFIVE